ncbi:LLM class flavin-dependent oxidoreductase [Candidatus Entotheonella palauensis]|uniref:LLM class flavin-dependent oxidoreductase n=1 Tax=Candidatus Entotheonella palauensis TaxID=93172 RepID=UPI000B7FCAB5|nr:LLM class flavin-dependent oxidoreductase [Candidatus Entotheonella palauensis]
MSIRISAELSHICPLDEVIAHATAMETHGFHRVWIPDTVVSAWEAWMAASLILQHTQRIQVGLGVTNPYTRHPVVVAQMAATLQTYSGGRLAMSLGKGIGRFLDKAGVTQHDTAVEECATILRGLIAGERTTFSGQAFQIDAMLLRTQPPHVPVPLYLAAIGPNGWASAMRVGDGVATVWGEALAETRLKFMAERVIPSAVLIPFAQSRTDFFARRVSTLEDLQQRVEVLDTAGFDEVIVAYAEMADLRTAAQLVQSL